MINPDICISNKNPSINFKKLNIDKLSILSLNCRSVRSQSKKALLQSIMEKHKADIVFGCESHLDGSFLSSEIFPSQYMVIRKDRYIGGGVFLALKNYLTVAEEPSFDGNTEMVWVKLCLNLSMFAPYIDLQAAQLSHSISSMIS